jgi:hypothetical protein
MIGELVSRTDQENAAIIRLTIPDVVITEISQSSRRTRRGPTGGMDLTRLPKASPWHGRKIRANFLRVFGSQSMLAYFTFPIVSNYSHSIII